MLEAKETETRVQNFFITNHTVITVQLYFCQKFFQLFSGSQEIIKKEVAAKELAENDLLKLKRSFQQLQLQLETFRRKVEINVEDLDEVSIFENLVFQQINKQLQYLCSRFLRKI